MTLFIEKKNAAKETMYKIFVENKIQENYGPKNTAMAQALFELTPDGVKTNLSTILQKWIPEYLKSKK